MTATATRPVTTTLAIPRPVTIAAILVAGIPFVLHAWVLFTGYFGHDDFVVLYRAAGKGPFDPAYLFQDYNGHIKPGTFLIAWLVTAIAPLSHTVAVIPLLAMQLAASVLLWRLLARVFGHRWPVLLPFAVFTFSPLIAFPTLWWAYGMELLPLLVTMFGALGSHVKYLETGERRRIWFTVIWSVAGMAFYEKAVLFVALLAGITLLLAPAGQRLAALKQHWRVWLVQGVLTALYLVIYITSTATPVRDSPLSVQAVAELARRTVVDTFVPGVLGGPWTNSSFGGAISTPSLTLRLVAAGLAIAIIIFGVLAGRSRAVLAWVLLLGYVAVDLALVITTRLHQVGPLIGNDPRYIADAVPIAVLCGAFAFLKPGGTETGLRRPLVIGLVALLGASATFSFLQLAPGLKFAQSRQYVDTARAGLEANPGITLYDTPVPREIMHEWFVEDGKASRVIGLLPGPPKFDQPAETMWALDDTGTPKKVTGIKEPAIGRPGPYDKCGYAVGYQTATIPLNRRVDHHSLLRMEYYSTGKGPVTIRLGKATQDVYFPDGLHVLYIVVEGGFDRVDINRATPVDPMCVVNVQVGAPLLR
ncbi:hypothetical protein JOF56_010359 [Kibdelosporangium banguiense]|uniref:Transmembrane protein n=1 Tax=Kibdelosporangium banguiense TaxID=1365924 RepID=A0ABS4TZY8_9PSEU|nr:hypothetical protein [Kibdelosporangium banguiense]MBP2329974.1 hypothetical protein [Kibdelosporangium banguiense]